MPNRADIAQFLAYVAFLVLVVAALILSAMALGYATAGAAGNDCRSWAEEEGIKGSANGDYAMHVMGCRKPYSTWKSSQGYCNRMARQEARKGLVPSVIVARVEARGKGLCENAEDGSWYDYSGR